MMWHDSNLFPAPAAVRGSVGAMVLLLDAGASLHAVDLTSCTPLHHAALSSKDSEAKVRELVLRGACVTDNHTATPLHLGS